MTDEYPTNKTRDDITRQGQAIRWYILQYLTWHYYPELRYDPGFMYLFS
jgi:hypothetical protein